MKLHLKAMLMAAAVAGITAVSSLTCLAEQTNSIPYTVTDIIWKDGRIRVEGYFSNTLSGKDVHSFHDGSFLVYDNDKNPIIEIKPYSGDFSQINIPAGGTWEYVMERDDEENDPAAFDLSGYSLGGSFQYSYSTCTGADCSVCAARSDINKTTDMASEAEWEEMKARLRASYAQGQNGSGSGGSSSKGGDDFSYTPIPPTPTYQKHPCKRCGGSGKVTCPKCDGVGYKEHREQAWTCLVVHHSDCPAYNNSKGKCNDCHSRHDYYMAKDKCTKCGGKKEILCDLCHGAGEY